MPIDLTQFLTATATVTLAVAIIVSLAKPYIETWWLPPSHALHDASLRIFAILVGIALVIVASLLEPSRHGVDGPIIFAAILAGGQAGLAAIVAYHLLSGSVFDQPTASLVVTPPSQPGRDMATVVPPQDIPTVVVTPSQKPEVPPSPETPPSGLILPSTAPTILPGAGG